MKTDTRFKPVRSRSTIQDQVYGQLREALASGAFEAGQGLTINALADMFQTSHMPIREALRRLAAEKALRISSTGTTYVPRLDPEALRQIHEARLVLEPKTVEIAFDRIGPAEVTRLHEIHARHTACGETGDVVAMLAANRAFHFGLYAASGNDVLVGQIENLWLRSGSCTRYLSDRMGDLLRTSYRTGYARHHERMLEALAAGDRQGLSRAMHDDINATHALLADFGYDDTAPRA